MKKQGKKLLCYLLSIAMVLSSLMLPQTSARVGAATADAQTEASSTKIDTSVQVLVDGTSSRSLKLYQSGLYEEELSLTNGEHKLQLQVDGALVGEATTIEVKDGKEVYVRYQNGELINSVTNADKFHTAALVGNFYGIEFLDDTNTRYDIASWTPSDANAELEYVGGGMYTRTFLFNKLSADVVIGDGGYKVAFDDSWDYSIGDGSSNIALTIPEGSSSLTVLVDEVHGKVYDSIRSGVVSVTQNSGAVTYSPIGLQVSLIGTIRNAGDSNWDINNKAYEFTQISDHVFVYQMAVNAGDYQYKLTFNHEKWYEKQDNRNLKVDKDTSVVVFAYDASTEEVYDSINDTSKLNILLGFEEEVTPEEPAASEIINNVNGTTRFVTTAASSAEDKVQLVYADRKNTANMTTVSLTKVTNASGEYKGLFTTADLFLGDAALDYVYYYLVNGAKVLDASTDTVTVDGVQYSSYVREAFTGRTVNVPGTFPGESWGAASNPMTYVGNGLYSYTFKQVPAANYQFKISMGSWSENYGVDGIADGANYSVTVTKTQDVTVYYTDLVTHRAVTSVNYVFATISLTGTNVPEGSQLRDDGLTGIYSCKITLPAGEYKDLVMTKDGVTYPVDAFTLGKEKDVTFCFDPATGIFYNDSNEAEINADNVYYDSKDTTYKSVFGAIATNQEVTFSIRTGSDVTKAQLVLKGKSNATIELEKSAKDGQVFWSAPVSIAEYGEYQYFFVLYNGSTVNVYCDDDGYYGTGVVTNLTSLKPYDLVVYKEGYETPDWMKDAVIYQIFPDRFYNGDKTNDTAQTTSRGDTNYELITDWTKIPENPEQEELHPEQYPDTAYKGDGVWSNEIYGGDLQGIIKRMDYLKALGVTVIYLNPVFSSISSHRYDTSDYTKIDPILGDLGDFTELVKKCKENGMHIVLDGVFNHVSDDSIYFDRYYKFVGQDGKVGAYPYWAYVYDYMTENNASEAAAKEAATAYFKAKNVTDFTYTEWFDIFSTTLKGDDGQAVQDTIGDRAGKDVYGYDGWWGYDSMPVIKATGGSEYQTSSWAEEIIDGNDSVCQYWLSQGSDGWRLDVANEVSDETWQHFRESVKSLSADNVIIGEIWDDATQYLLGDMYDSVMNYIFRNAVLSYAKGGNAADSVKNLEKIRERYPQEAYYAMMNLVGSHDTTRLLSYLDGIDDDRNQKDPEDAFPTYEATSAEAKARQYLVAFIQMTYPGAPTIYYGDEIGMVGADDPDDRRAMTWGKGNKELVEWYATMAAIRSEYPALRTGAITPFTVTDNGQELESIMAYVRSDENNEMIVLSNNTTSDITVTIPLTNLITIKGSNLTEVVSGQSYQVTDNAVQVTIPACKGIILSEKVNNVVVNKEALKVAYEEPTPEPEKPVIQVPTVTELKVTKKLGIMAVLNWKRTPGVLGYDVEMKAGDGNYRDLFMLPGSYLTSYIVPFLKRGTTYSFRVRAYKYINGKKQYGEYSEVVSIKM